MEPIIEYLSAGAAWTGRNSLAASVFAGAVLLISRLMGHRLHPRLIALLWVLVGIRLILPVAPGSSFSMFQFLPPFAIAGEGSHPVEALTDPETAPAIPPVIAGGGESRLLLPKESVSPLSTPNWMGFLAAVWAGVATGLILHTLHRQWRLTRVTGKLPAVSDPELRQLLVQCAMTSDIPVRFRFVTAQPLGLDRRSALSRRAGDPV